MWTRKRPLTDVPSFTTTPYGVLAHVPFIERPGTQLGVVVLFGNADYAYGLPIEQCLDSNDRSHHPLYALYHRHWYIVCLTPEDIREHSAPAWRDVYLSRLPPFETASENSPVEIPLTVKYMNVSPSSPFRVNAGPEVKFSSWLKLMDASTIPLTGWTGSPPLTLLFKVRRPVAPRVKFLIVVAIGVCSRTRKHWATTAILRTHPQAGRSHPAWQRDGIVDAHACETDHIDQWQERDGHRWKAIEAVSKRPKWHIITYFRSLPAAARRESQILEANVEESIDYPGWEDVLGAEMGDEHEHDPENEEVSEGEGEDDEGEDDEDEDLDG